MPSLTPIVLNRMPTRPAALHAFLHLVGQLVEVHVAGVALVPDAGDADLRLLHVGFGQARGVEHGLRGALRFGLRDPRAVFVQCHGEMWISVDVDQGQTARYSPKWWGLQIDCSSRRAVACRASLRLSPCVTAVHHRSALSNAMPPAKVKSGIAMCWHSHRSTPQESPVQLAASQDTVRKGRGCFRNNPFHHVSSVVISKGPASAHSQLGKGREASNTAIIRRMLALAWRHAGRCLAVVARQTVLVAINLTAWA